jgi:hypothetical protein
LKVISGKDCSAGIKGVTEETWFVIEIGLPKSYINSAVLKQKIAALIKFIKRTIRARHAVPLQQPTI